MTIIVKGLQMVVVWQCQLSQLNILSLLTAVESPLELDMQLILMDEFHRFLLKNFRHDNCCVSF